MRCAFKIGYFWWYYHAYSIQMKRELTAHQIIGDLQHDSPEPFNATWIRRWVPWMPASHPGARLIWIKDPWGWHQTKSKGKEVIESSNKSAKDKDVAGPPSTPDLNFLSKLQNMWAPVSVSVIVWTRKGMKLSGSLRLPRSASPVLLCGGPSCHICLLAWCKTIGSGCWEKSLFPAAEHVSICFEAPQPQRQMTRRRLAFHPSGSALWRFFFLSSSTWFASFTSHFELKENELSSHFKKGQKGSKNPSHNGTLPLEAATLGIPRTPCQPKLCDASKVIRKWDILFTFIHSLFCTIGRWCTDKFNASLPWSTKWGTQPPLRQIPLSASFLCFSSSLARLVCSKWSDMTFHYGALRQRAQQSIQTSIS